MSDKGLETKNVRLVLRKGVSFHPDADTAISDQAEQFKDRLEDTSIELHRHDGSDNVSTHHVTHAYGSLVSPTKKRKLLELISTGLFGAFLSAFIAVLIDLGGQSSAPTTVQLVLTALFFVGCVVSAICMAYNVQL